jgi:hypothetical protein
MWCENVDFLNFCPGFCQRMTLKNMVMNCVDFKISGKVLTRKNYYHFCKKGLNLKFVTSCLIESQNVSNRENALLSTHALIWEFKVICVLKCNGIIFNGCSIIKLCGEQLILKQKHKLFLSCTYIYIYIFF